MDKAICIINEGISGSYVNEPDKTVIFRTTGQSIPTTQQAVNTTQTKQEQMDDVLETINIALTGAASLLRKISTENTRLLPELPKIMKAAMDSTNTLTV